MFPLFSPLVPLALAGDWAPRAHAAGAAVQHLRRELHRVLRPGEAHGSHGPGRASMAMGRRGGEAPRRRAEKGVGGGGGCAELWGVWGGGGGF